jgi:hypothetical protein
MLGQCERLHRDCTPQTTVVNEPCRSAHQPSTVLYQAAGYNVQQIVSNYIAGGGNLKSNPLYPTPASFQGAARSASR